MNENESLNLSCPTIYLMSLKEGKDYYLENELIVFTEKFLTKRGYCCKNGCRHCPYMEEKEKKYCRFCGFKLIKEKWIFFDEYTGELTYHFRCSNVRCTKNFHYD